MLRDQFEWPLDPCTPHADDSDVPRPVAHPTPESFARQLCSDMCLGSEFVSMIAHSIREQLYQARLNPIEAPRIGELECPPVRPTDPSGGWVAEVREMTSKELAAKDQEQERERRRLRRSQRSAAASASTAIQITGVSQQQPMSNPMMGPSTMQRPGILPPDAYSAMAGQRRVMPAMPSGGPAAPPRFNPYALGGAAIPASSPRPYPGQYTLLPQQQQQQQRQQMQYPGIMPKRG